jgi:hypothetical protein
VHALCDGSEHTNLVAGSGIEFHDRGEHELRGVPGTWRPFAVRALPARKRAVISKEAGILKVPVARTHSPAALASTPSGIALFSSVQAEEVGVTATGYSGADRAIGHQIVPLSRDDVVEMTTLWTLEDTIQTPLH